MAAGDRGARVRARLPAPSSQLPAAPHRSPQPPNTHTSRGRSGGGDEALRVSGLARHGTAPRPQRAHCTRPPPGPISAGALAPSRSAPVTPRQKVSPFPPLSTPSSVKGGHSGIVITVSRMDDWTSLAQHKRKPEIPVVTRETRRNSRKTTWLPRHRKMRPLPAGAPQEKSHVPI